MTERYVGGHKMFKKTYKTFNDACRDAQNGDTIILNSGTVKVPRVENQSELVRIPSGDIEIQGNKSRIVIPHDATQNVIGLAAGGNCNLKIKNLDVTIGSQVVGFALGAMGDSLSGSVIFENCHFHYDKPLIRSREMQMQMLAKIGADSLQDQMLPAKLKFVNCSFDMGYFYAQQIEADHCHFGSVNANQTQIMTMSGIFNDCSFDNLILANISQQASIINNCSFGMSNNLVGAWNVSQSKAEYHTEMDKGLNKRKLNKALTEYDLVENQSVITSYDLDNLKSILTIDGLTFDVDSYQKWTDRQGSFAWFDLSGSENRLKNIKIPKVPDNLTNLAANSITLDNVQDESNWTVQNGTEIQNRNSDSRLIGSARSQSALPGQNKKSDDAMEELNQMIGLTTVKEQMAKLLATEKVNHMREVQGLSSDQINRNMIFAGPAGTGKAILDDEVLPTPMGFKQAKKLKKGDLLFGSNGKATKIQGVYPQGKRTVYQLTLRDGRQVKCSGDHIWHVKINQKWQDLTVKELLPYKGKCIELPEQKTVEYQKQNHLPLNPYVIGFLTAGCTLRAKALSITCDNQQIMQRFVDELHDSRYQCHLTVTPYANEHRSNAYFFKSKEGLMRPDQQRIRERHIVYISDLINEAYQMKAEERYLPLDYLTSSVNERQALLQGIVDSAGMIDHQQVLIKVQSAKLAQQIKQLILSLGMNAVILHHQRFEVIKIYDVNMTLFTDKHKSEIATVNTLHLENKIVKIQKLDEEASMRCFYVDADDHLFMTNDFVVTHNTTVAKLFAKALYQNGLIDSSRTVIVKVSEMKGEHIGESGQNMNKAIERALGGVLFIDEAYALDAGEGGSKDSYNLEMQNAIIHAAEDHYKDLVIIMAGYLNDMRHFIDTNNEGFKSRFPNWILFPAYTPKEMAQILLSMIKHGDYQYADVAAQKAAIQAAMLLGKNQQRGNGNGRLMRTLYDRIRSAMSLRITNTIAVPDADDLTTITKEDVVNAYHQTQAQNDSEMGGN